METYVFDACSLIAFFEGEPGSDKVRDIIIKANRGNCIIYINKINLLEIYYGFLRDDGRETAEKAFSDVLSLPVSIVDILGDDLIKEAGRIKAVYKVSLADSIAIAEAKIRKARLVSSDHHELDIIDKKGEVDFLWIR
ncbi:MAG: type II toxin-antitoxin system VapC family toxin [Spirochaetota bacterium]